MREHERAALEARRNATKRYPSENGVAEIETGAPPVSISAVEVRGGTAWDVAPPPIPTDALPDAPAAWTPLDELRKTVRDLRADIATYEGGIRNAEHTYRASVDSYRQRIRTAEHKIREWEALIVLATVRAPEEGADDAA